MTIYASKTPRDLYGDRTVTSTIVAEDGSVSTRDLPGRGIMLDRSSGSFSFGAVQQNEPNPILVDIRAHKGAVTSWGNMLRAVAMAADYSGHYVTKDWERITDDGQITHARRVLLRLAALEAAEAHRA